MTGKAFAAIPVRNEAADIIPCLRALAAQGGPPLDGTVLCLNNCADDTAALVRQAAPTLPFALHVLDVELTPELACAGVARRMAMDRAAELAGEGGVVLTTDADGRAAPGWLAANLAALRRGADAVAGQADIDPVGAALIPQYLHDIDARECAYAALLDEIVALVDPDPADPWPRHDEHSGASIAVTTAAYRRAGGMPPSPIGEDRAFFAALRRVDARIRHERAARVVVSARTIGRAPGGMADTIRRRMQVVDSCIDDRLEPALAALHRAALRARLRNLWRGEPGTPARLARALRMPIANLLRAPCFAEGCFGETWAKIEAASPALAPRRVALADLAQETARALRVRNWLRGAAAVSGAEDRAGTPLPLAAE